jgi:hypothetical protein
VRSRDRTRDPLRAISAEQFDSALKQDGVPPGVTEPLAYLFTEVLDGRNAYLTGGVRRALAGWR